MVQDKRNSISYTLKHRKAFLEIEKRLLGHNTIRGHLHDLDKIFLKLFLSKDMVSRIHRAHARHHAKNACTKQDYVQMVVDWECARYTKPDKPLNARETLYRYYPELESKIIPILKELNL